MRLHCGILVNAIAEVIQRSLTQIWYAHLTLQEPVHAPVRSGNGQILFIFQLRIYCGQFWEV